MLTCVKILKKILSSTLFVYDLGKVRPIFGDAIATNGLIIIMNIYSRV